MTAPMAVWTAERQLHALIRATVAPSSCASPTVVAMPKGGRVRYTGRTADGETYATMGATILHVHSDDPDGTYYTIQLDDASERQVPEERIVIHEDVDLRR